MIIGQIKDGIVIDHITAGKGMTLYNFLGLDKIDCQVALIKNADSVKMGKKDIIKIDRVIDLDMDALGYLDPGATVNIIENSKIAKRAATTLPERVENVIRCKNPRCITTVEQELPHIFTLRDKDNRVYRCLYCESKAK
ncbi:MAG: aspartate carbamoyltransferase regulatory subunit [Clostridia bacterium]|nr:aspartate carbamoyltransferase regulatory subunit [Clostridia bacterium]